MGLRQKLILVLFISIIVVLIPLRLKVGSDLSKITALNDRQKVKAIARLLEKGSVSSKRLDQIKRQKQIDLIEKSDPRILEVKILEDAARLGTTISKTDKGEIITRSINVKGKPAGYVQVHFKEASANINWINLVALASLVIALITVIVYDLLTRLITARVGLIKRATGWVVGGDLDRRLPVGRGDELADLSTQFNQMMQTLEEQAIENRMQATNLKQSFNQVQLEAQTDTLTQLFNRRYLKKHLGASMRGALSRNEQLAFLFCDLDNFKDYNDILGHQEGDQALKAVGVIVKACLRETDVAARFGGEEFALILKNTGVGGAKAVADRIRRAVENFAGQTDRKAPILTISIGIAMLTPQHDSVEKLVEEGDLAMYQAKRNGKNCVVVYSDDMPVHAGTRP